jgi:predicted RNase H-like HicB family nuclease
MKTYLFPILVECLEEGGYYAECPLLQGCHVEGRTYTETVENLEDAIRVFMKSYRQLGKKIGPIPQIKRRSIVTGGIPVSMREVS